MFCDVKVRKKRGESLNQVQALVGLRIEAINLIKMGCKDEGCVPIGLLSVQWAPISLITGSLCWWLIALSVWYKKKKNDSSLLFFLFVNLKLISFYTARWYFPFFFFINIYIDRLYLASSSRHVQFVVRTTPEASAMMWAGRKDPDRKHARTFRGAFLVWCVFPSF